MASSAILPKHYFSKIKRHEIIEVIVTTVCECFNVDNWKDLRDKHLYYHLAPARMAIGVLIMEEFNCNQNEINKYFRIYASDVNGTRCVSELNRYLSKDINVVHNYEIAKIKIQRKIENIKYERK